MAFGSRCDQAKEICDTSTRFGGGVLCALLSENKECKSWWWRFAVALLLGPLMILRIWWWRFVRAAVREQGMQVLVVALCCGAVTGTFDDFKNLVVALICLHCDNFENEDNNNDCGDNMYVWHGMIGDATTCNGTQVLVVAFIHHCREKKKSNLGTLKYWLVRLCWG